MSRRAFFRALATSTAGAAAAVAGTPASVAADGGDVRAVDDPRVPLPIISGSWDRPLPGALRVSARPAMIEVYDGAQWVVVTHGV